MAVDAIQWRMIVEAKVTGKALSAGYPDLLLTPDDVAKDGIPVRLDSTKVQNHHSWPTPIADSHAVFKAYGLDLDVIDRSKYQGCERVVDLNGDSFRCATDPHEIGDNLVRNPLELGEYDLVIDPGTSEHCFNVAQALVNLASCVKVGGVISQAIPLAMFNHGYYNINPVAFVDFYDLNGFKIEKMVLRSEEGIFEGNMRARLKGVPDGAVTVLLARRLEKKPFQWPQQK